MLSTVHVFPPLRLSSRSSRAMVRAGNGKRSLRPLAAIVLSLVAGGAWAQSEDTLQPYAGLAYSYEDNLLRVQNTAAVAEPSDLLRSVFAGLRVQGQLGRQSLSASARVTRVNFDNHPEYNYNGKTADLNWGWVLGNHLSGAASASYVQTLMPFTDLRTTERNLRSQTGAGFDGGWTFYPSWRVRAGVRRDKYDYEQASQKNLNRDVDAGVLGLDYTPTTGSSIGLQLRREQGKYDVLQYSGNVPYRQDYTQDEVKLKLLWQVSGLTRLEFLGGRASRKHDEFAISDASGFNARGKATWQATRTVRLDGELWREFGAFEGDIINYSLDRGASVSANWVATAKIQAEAEVHRLHRTLSGSTPRSAILGGDDTGVGASASVSYQPHRRVSLSLRAFRETRKANSLFSSSYHANGATVSASVQF
ncbi:XrtB/PEP-CTERM-associated polysaccharide biosynthesis outer membrane protein EpsL [Oxalobacteraceae bacterium A2-2]